MRYVKIASTIIFHLFLERFLFIKIYMNIVYYCPQNILQENRQWIVIKFYKSTSINNTVSFLKITFEVQQKENASCTLRMN